MKTHGVERAQERSALKAAYDAGASIRTLAAAHGHSYGYVHDALTEAGTQLRGARRTEQPRTQRPCTREAGRRDAALRAQEQ